MIFIIVLGGYKRSRDNTIPPVYLRLSAIVVEPSLRVLAPLEPALFISLCMSVALPPGG